MQDAFEQGVQVLGALVQKARQLLARFDRQGRGQHRGDGLVEKPQAQVQGPASEDHPGEGIGGVPATAQFGRQHLAQRPEGRPLLGGRFHRRRLAGTKLPGHPPALLFQMGVDRSQPLQKDLF